MNVIQLVFITVTALFVSLHVLLLAVKKTIDLRVYPKTSFLTRFASHIHFSTSVVCLSHIR